MKNNLRTVPGPALKPEEAKAKAKADAAAASVADTYGTLVNIDNKLHIDTQAPGADGLVTITVTTYQSAISNKQLKVLIGRLGNAPSVRWSNHKGLGDGRKQIVGKVSVEARVEAFSKLIEVAERYK